MLDRVKVLKELELIKETLFLDNSQDLAIARTLWNTLAADPLFVHKAQPYKIQMSLPSWSEPLETIHKTAAGVSSYIVHAVDGSQIYPDRHQGTFSFLINIGSVQLRYGTPSFVRFNSQPFVYTDRLEIFDASAEIVDCQRQLLELQIGLELCAQIKEEAGEVPFLFLVDGSLIFWHLQSKEVQVKHYFFNRYKEILEQFYQLRIKRAGQQLQVISFTLEIIKRERDKQ